MKGRIERVGLSSVVLFVGDELQWSRYNPRYPTNVTLVGSRYVLT